MIDQKKAVQFLTYIKKQGVEYRKIIDILEAKLERKDLQDREELILFLRVIKAENLDLKLAEVMMQHLWEILEKTIEPEKETW